MVIVTKHPQLNSFENHLNIVTPMSMLSGCNACRGSPNSAPSAINVGATDINDKVAYFSDIGEIDRQLFMKRIEAYNVTEDMRRDIVYYYTRDHVIYIRYKLRTAI